MDSSVSDPRESKRFPLKKGSRYTQVPFNIDLTLFVQYISEPSPPQKKTTQTILNELSPEF